jgi:hypothetical protein
LALHRGVEIGSAAVAGNDVGGFCQLKALQLVPLDQKGAPRPSVTENMETLIRFWLVFFWDEAFGVVMMLRVQQPIVKFDASRCNSWNSIKKRPKEGFCT